MSTTHEPQQIRRRKVKPAVIKAVEDLDVFPKVPETCVETTSYGGTASIVALVITIWLVVLEFRYFLDTGYKFKFSPDTNWDDKLTINVDMTVAMPCSLVGADVVDSTSQNVLKFGELEEEFVHFDLSPSQRAYFNAKANLNSYLREQYHSLRELLWRRDFIDTYNDMPKLSSKEKFDMGAASACRLYGTLVLNKVAGNFHITAGKTLPLPRGHAHIAAFMTERDYNFSHRIYKFSFGDGMPSIVHPLEGDEKFATINHMSYQYFISIVPTIVKTRFRTYHTFQYSVRETHREIDHDKGSHGISGIFFKYDMSGLQVEVDEEEYPWWRFLVRLCAVIGGVYATVGMLYNHLSLLGCGFQKLRGGGQQDVNSKNYNYNKYNNPTLIQPTTNPNPILPHQQPLNNSYNNPMISNNTNTLFETQEIQFLQQQGTNNPLLCDIAADSDSAALITNLDSESNNSHNNPLLPDLLASHASST